MPEPVGAAGALGGRLPTAACRSPACFAEGAEAGAEAAAAAGFDADHADGAARSASPQPAPLLPIWVGADASRTARAKAFVDFQNDVTAKDLGLAVREGFQSIEHVKRYTTTGMGTDQGKTSNVNALAIVAGKRGIADPGGRHHHLPHALHAGHLRRAGRPAQRRAVRPDPPHAEP